MLSDRIGIRPGFESAKIRPEVERFISKDMNGIDVGSGGAPVFLQSISIDKKARGCFSDLVQLKGDARNLYWFRDGVLDYVFSSHCLEDFDHSAKVSVLEEWVRVLKPGGYLLLYLPDEHKFREYCSKHGLGGNPNHKDPDFNISKLRVLISENNLSNRLEEVYSIAEHNDYCFFLVYKKKGGV